MHQLFKQNNYFSHRSATRDQKYKWSSVQLRIVNFAVSETFWDAAMFFLKPLTFRSRHPKVFLEKGVLKICSKFTGEHPCRSAISTKLQSNFIEITLQHGCSPVNFLDLSEHFFLRTPLKGCFWNYFTICNKSLKGLCLTSATSYTLSCIWSLSLAKRFIRLCQ